MKSSLSETGAARRHRSSRGQANGAEAAAFVTATTLVATAAAPAAVAVAAASAGAQAATEHVAVPAGRGTPSAALAAEKST